MIFELKKIICPVCNKEMKSEGSVKDKDVFTLNGEEYNPIISVFSCRCTGEEFDKLNRGYRVILPSRKTDSYVSLIETNPQALLILKELGGENRFFMTVRPTRVNFKMKINRRISRNVVSVDYILAESHSMGVVDYVVNKDFISSGYFKEFIESLESQDVRYKPNYKYLEELSIL